MTMGCTLDFGVDPRSPARAEGVDNRIATAAGGIVEEVALLLGLLLLERADADFHDAVEKGVGVLVPSGLEVLLDGLPHLTPRQRTNMAVSIRGVVLDKLDTRVELRPLRIGYAAQVRTLLAELDPPAWPSWRPW